MINPENYPTEIKSFSHRTEVSPKEKLVLPPNLIFIQSSNENEGKRQKFFDFSLKVNIEWKTPFSFALKHNRTISVNEKNRKKYIVQRKTYS